MTTKAKSLGALAFVGMGCPKEACPEAWGKCKRTSPVLLLACQLFLQHLCSLGESRGQERASVPRTGSSPQVHRPQPRPVQPLSPLVGVCQPRLSPQPSSGGSGFWCHCIITSCSLLCFQKTPGPGAYTASAQFPKQPRTIAKMGREHSLFYNNTIGF